MSQERTVTTLYRRYASADLVRCALRDHGIELARISVVPDRASGIDDATDFGLFDAVIDDLGLPEADARMYQDAIRRGDFVVSATVPVPDAPRVEEIMCHPEAFADRVSPEHAEAEIRRERDSEATEGASPRPVDLTIPIGR